MSAARFRIARRARVTAAAVCLLAGGASAQSLEPSAALPRVFAGAGIGPATSDADSRMAERFFGDSTLLAWFIEGGAAIASRIGAGAEFVDLGAVTASTRGQSFNSSGRQEERVLLAIVRGRVSAASRIAFDLVGGGGVLFQHHELRFAPCFTGCANSLNEVLDRRAPAVAVGADIPVRLGRHVDLAGVVRCYALLRGEHLSRLPDLVPWQYEHQSSARFSASISARAVW